MVYTYTVIITAIHISRFLKKWHPYLHLRGICFASFPENLVMKAKKVRNQKHANFRWHLFATWSSITMTRECTQAKLSRLDGTRAEKRFSKLITMTVILSREPRWYADNARLRAPK